MGKEIPDWLKSVISLKESREERRVQERLHKIEDLDATNTREQNINEAAIDILVSHWNRLSIDSLIEDIRKTICPDGYLTTLIILPKKDRFNFMNSNIIQRKIMLHCEGIEHSGSDNMPDVPSHEADIFILGISDKYGIYANYHSITNSMEPLDKPENLKDDNALKGVLAKFLDEQFKILDYRSTHPAPDDSRA